MSKIEVDSLTHTGNNSTDNLILASSGAVTTADDLTVGDNLVATKQNGCQRIVLEQFYTPCDGSTIATANGNITVGDVTAVWNTSTTYADITGSTIAYTPPTGTTQVIYEFSYHYSGSDASPLWHKKLFLDSDEVVHARESHYHDNTRDAGRMHFKWAFNIGGSADTDSGRVASWSSSKTIKCQGRSYADSLDAKLHQTYYWDGAATSVLCVPCVGITAIG